MTILRQNTRPFELLKNVIHLFFRARSLECRESRAGLGTLEERRFSKPIEQRRRAFGRTPGAASKLPTARSSPPVPPPIGPRL
eukprot:3972563-Pyramimonas_sp.AAC.1